MQRGCIMAKNQPLPEKYLKDLKTDADKAKNQLLYRTDLIKLARKLLDLEEAVLTGKSAEAKKLADEVAKMRETSHEALGVKDD
jgi:ABC-type Fe3+/spermidine/putrescine transport system ATPase subunit